jgi:antagonist of KipI
VTLEVISPGLLSTVQDAGRTAVTDLGVPISGACDPLARAAANLLLGNEPADPVLEITLTGPVLAARESVVVALAGADFDARVDEDGRRLRPGSSLLLRAGTTLRFGSARDGARACLALAGGIDVPMVLGSASTAPVGGFGGLDGRPLREGDLIRARERGLSGTAGRVWPGPGASSGVSGTHGARVVRALEGPDEGAVSGAALDQLWTTDWTVGARSDRVGVRLEGGRLEGADGELLSHGMVWGAVEVPPGGAPIILLADHPTVGGYPVPAVVAAVDRPVLGQLRPGDRVRLERVDLHEAHRLRTEADALLAEAASRLRMAQAIG